METYFDKIEEQHGTLARERVFADLQALANDAEDLLKATAHDACEKSKELRTRLTSAVERARETCATMQARATARAKEAARRTDNLIRKRPYESLGVALGLGLLLGLLVVPR